ncbi:SMC-Scp complex subunit ScpB [Candidatus Uhrbacteria bacterium]|nr:SMC-Scp complex subunit ScpB [Candidatus Uhrbacteria bacterium]
MEYPLTSTIEALLFIAQRPLPIKKIAQYTGASIDDVTRTLETLAQTYSTNERGIILIVHNDHAELATNPAHSALVQAYTKDEVSGDLTRAGLETLTIIAYRGPLTKAQIEQIRGVNCTIVLRNLAMRGAIEMTGESDGEKLYTLSFDFLRQLGIQNVANLPEYESLHSADRLADLLESKVERVYVSE